MRNQLQTYFLPDDESALSIGLRKISQSIFFVDYDEAVSDKIELYFDLKECGSGFAHIWDAETNDITSATEKWNKLARIKSLDVATVQYHRSRVIMEELVTGEEVSLLLSGRVAMMGKGTEKQKDLRTRVYNVVSKIAKAEIFHVSPTTREVIGKRQVGSRVGLHAIDWCKDSSHLLRHKGNILLYGLPPTQESR